MQQERTAPSCKGCSKEPTEVLNIRRIIEKLDRYFAHNDLDGALAHLDYWEREGLVLGDMRGVLSLLNEKIGLYRRTNDAEKGLCAVERALVLVDELALADSLSGATIFINAATTMKAFGKAAESLSLYKKAEQGYGRALTPDRYEWAALYNNMASALSALSRHDEAEACYQKAITILKREGKHDGEIAVSYVNLAHLFYERDPANTSSVTAALHTAWEYLLSPRQPHDGNYAFICSKCAPSYAFFGWEDEANALDEVAKEIYEGS